MPRAARLARSPPPRQSEFPRSPGILPAASRRSKTVRRPPRALNDVRSQCSIQRTKRLHHFQERPIADFQPQAVLLRCGPSNRTVAASAFLETSELIQRGTEPQLHISERGARTVCFMRTAKNSKFIKADLQRCTMNQSGRQKTEFRKRFLR